MVDDLLQLENNVIMMDILAAVKVQIQQVEDLEKKFKVRRKGPRRDWGRGEDHL
ncbi:TPA: hypothetical protein ACKFKV_003910 [Klebsiella oxytoca]